MEIPLVLKGLPVIILDTYDAVTASGCFGVSLVPCGALYEMIRLVKPGITSKYFIRPYS